MTDSFVFSRDQPYQDTDIRPVRLRGLHHFERLIIIMAKYYLGPLGPTDIDEIKRALKAHLESVEDCIENGPVFTPEEAVKIAQKQNRIGKLLDMVESLVLKE